MITFIESLRNRDRKGMLAELKIYLRIRHAVEQFCPDYDRIRTRELKQQLT